ncbi:MAG: aminomethyl-transferring glycine dehydrogenase subunit GcvPB [Myxococcales bacterium]|nr:aminomethyl-transferring glycine dehydrogenase subunit GcvPB [Myxococcales bacterium]
MNEPLIFERSVPGRFAFSLPGEPDNAEACVQVIPDKFRRKTRPLLPEVNEVELVRHYTRLSQWNYGIDTGPYPLGSCTMKHNPRINEAVARLEGFTAGHPYHPELWLQGSLNLMFALETFLGEISGLPGVTLQPAAGAHGEFTGVRIMRRALLQRDGNPRSQMIVPDTAHGTNPATCAMNGYSVVHVASNDKGIVDADSIVALMTDDVAGIMITNPNTLGLFEEQLPAIAAIVHAKGGYVYGDGANLNSLLGRARPGDLGVDIMHFNLHKTFSTPHGGGGPGAGPVGVTEALERFLPVPRIRKAVKDGGETYYLEMNNADSIGRIKAFFGNFGMLVRAYAYIRELGPDGLKQVTDMAVLNANYVLAGLRDTYHVPYDRLCMHECVVTDKYLHKVGVKTMDVAKRLIDYGFHPPTVYFPLCVAGALMIEPTETESKQSLDEFVEAMLTVAKESLENPELLLTAPHRTRVSRMDEVRAARQMELRFQSKPE